MKDINSKFKRSLEEKGTVVLTQDEFINNYTCIKQAEPTDSYGKYKWVEFGKYKTQDVRVCYTDKPINIADTDVAQNIIINATKTMNMIHLFIDDNIAVVI